MGTEEEPISSEQGEKGNRGNLLKGFVASAVGLKEKRGKGGVEMGEFLTSSANTLAPGEMIIRRHERASHSGFFLLKRTSEAVGGREKKR